MPLMLKKGDTLIPLGTTVNIGNKGIEIPSIEGFETDEFGILTWVAPDISNLKEFNPSLSYVLDMNGRIVETKETQLDALQYLNDGNNYVSIKVKIALQDEGYNKQYHFSKPIQYIIVLSQKMPNMLKYTASTTDDNGNIYIFGGADSNNNGTSKLYKFNPKTYVIEEFNIQRLNEFTQGYYDFENCYSTIIYNNNYIYVFGGTSRYGSTYTNEILKIDLSNKKAEKIANLPNYNNRGYNKGFCFNYKNFIYYIGREYTNDSRGYRIFKLNIENNEIIDLDFSFTAVYWLCNKVINDSVYLYISYDGVNKFNLLTETIERLDIKDLSSSSSTYRAVYYKNNILLIGSTYKSNPIEAIIIDYKNLTSRKIDLDTQLISYLPSVESSNNKIYIFYGEQLTDEIIESVIL